MPPGPRAAALPTAPRAAALSGPRPLARRAGFSAQAPTVWLLEGFIGYITAEQQGELARQLHALSAPGSAALLTAPPSEQTRRDMLAMGVVLHHRNFDPAGAVAARFAAAGWAQRQLLTSEALAERYGIPQHLDVLELERE